MDTIHRKRSTPRIRVSGNGDPQPSQNSQNPVLQIYGMDMKGDKHHDRNHDPDCAAVDGRRSTADGHRAGNRRSHLEETGPETGGAGKSLDRSAAQGDYPGIDEEGMK